MAVQRGLGRFRPGGGQTGRAFLAVVALGLCAGGALRLIGAVAGANVAWAVTTAAALLPSAVSIIRDLVRRKAGVDMIALLAMAGALALGEYFVGAVIAVMYSSGLALEEYASGSAPTRAAGTA